MPLDIQPFFPTYLLPSFEYPFRRRPREPEPVSQNHRQASTSSATSNNVPALSFSPISSTATTPDSSPPSPRFILPQTGDSKGKEKSTAQEHFQSISAQHTDKLVPATKPRNARLHCAQPNTLRCSSCATDLALPSQIVSKGFTGRHGRAYLVAPSLSASQACYPPPRLDSKSKEDEWKHDELINLRIGRSMNRELLTGMHVVADLSCRICGTTLGWKYVDAREASQKYKVGKFILEMQRVVLRSGWEDVLEKDVESYAGEQEYLEEEGEDEVVFDSGDEDECDDIFAGVWDAETVRKRRAKKIGGWARGYY